VLSDVSCFSIFETLKLTVTRGFWAQNNECLSLVGNTATPTIVTFQYTTAITTTIATTIASVIPYVDSFNYVTFSTSLIPTYTETAWAKATSTGSVTVTQGIVKARPVFVDWQKSDSQVAVWASEQIAASSTISVIPSGDPVPQPRSNTPSTQSGKPLSPVIIGGAVSAAIMLILLLLAATWMALRHQKRKKAKQLERERRRQGQFLFSLIIHRPLTFLQRNSLYHRLRLP
jgi:hypothetical protein